MSNLNLPDGWKVLPLSQLGSFSRGKGITKADLQNDGIPCIRYGEIYTLHHHSVKRFHSFINADLAKSCKELKYNDLLFAGSGETLEGIGKAVGYRLKQEAFAGGDIVILSLKDQYRSDYIAYYLNSLGRKQINKLGAGHSVVHIYSRDLGKVFVTLPPKLIQDRIVDILEQWDTAIEKTEALIDAKERQFGWLIHHMVGENQTNDQWQEYSLGELFVVSTHVSKSSSICDDGKNFIVDMGSISRQGLLVTHKRTNLHIDMLQKGELVMPKDDIGGGNIIGKVAVIDSDEKYVCGDHVYRLKAKHEINTCFAKYVINSVPINKRLRAKANGTSQLGLGKKDVLKQAIRLPELSVQQNIANTFNTAKQEITLLKKLADQYRTQKRGLMQKLLSGEWHIKNKEAE